jgi:hypothetical protein
MTTAMAERPETQQPKCMLPVVLYSVTEETIANMREKFRVLAILGTEDKEGRDAVHDARMACVRARSAIEKTRKELKADSLEYGRRVDSEAKRLTDMVAPIEKRLLEQEEKIQAEIQKIEKEKSDRLYANRVEALTAVGGTVGGAFPEVLVRSMGDDEFAMQLAHIDRQVKERKAREEREALEAAERKRIADAEAARLKAENERLEAERIEFNRQRREQEEAQRIERERLEKIQRDQDAERQRLEAENRRLQEQEAARVKAEQDRIDTERRQKEADDRARAQAEEKARQDKEAVDRAERLRPDMERLAAVADNVDAISVPKVSDDAQEIAEKIGAILDAAAEQIRRITSGKNDQE